MSVINNMVRDIIYGNYFTAFLRIAVGLLFIYSGFFKVLDLESFGRIILMYNILPEILAPYFAIILSHLEIILGFLLLVGYKIRSASFISIMLMIVFIIAISVNLARGASFDCGCFELGRFGISEDISAILIVRNTAFLLILLALLNAKRNMVSLEAFIEKKRLSEL
jgi:uncharacterized membrane protein YphA (DoxX/SURF4 family)